MIDLSTLPPPDFVEEIDFEVLLASFKADLISRNETVEPVLALEGESLTILLEAAAYIVTLTRTRINQVGKDALLAHARGGTLDHLGALVATTRLTGLDADDNPLVETDVRFRARIQEAFERLTTAGPKAAYEAYATGADVRIAHTLATSPAPGEVVVAVLPLPPLDDAPADMLASVEAAVNAKDVRPLTDQVSVIAAQPVVIDVTATLFIGEGPSAALVEEDARASVDAYLASIRQVGHDVPISGLHAALHVDGVTRVSLTNPVIDQELTVTQAPVQGEMNITVEVSHAG